MFDLVLGHTCFLGSTGYANHARNFFSSINERISVGIDNLTEGDTQLTKTQQDMLARSTMTSQNMVHIVLNTTSHPVFWSDIEGPKIAYNVWESTRQPKDFFARLMQYDQLWVPSQWQRECSIAQGYPADRVKIVHEGISIPEKTLPRIRPDKFRFLLVGRWEYRKSTTEIIAAFLAEFPTEDVELVCLVDNPFAVDGLSTTEERLINHGFVDSRIKIQHFVSDQDYVELIKSADVFVSCARSEGWNIPLMEAIAYGVPSICSRCSGQLEFTNTTPGVYFVDVLHKTTPKQTYPPGSTFPGMWYEPNFEQLRHQMRYLYEELKNGANTQIHKAISEGARYIQQEFSWNKAVDQAIQALEELSMVKAPTPNKANQHAMFYVPSGELLNLSSATVTSANTYDEVFRRETYNYNRCRIDNCKVVLDCGANIGVFSRWAELHGAVDIYAFEPEKANYDVLCKNVPNAKCFNVAIGKESAIGKLAVHEACDGHRMISAEIRDSYEYSEQQISVVSLDSVLTDNTIDRVDLLKIDTEGSELSIFDGLSDNNLAKIDRIVVEYHNSMLGYDVRLRKQLIDRLYKNGFIVEMVRLDKEDRTQMIYAYKDYVAHTIAGIDELDIHIDFRDSPFCEIKGTSDREFGVEFIDNDTSALIYNTTIKSNMWTRTSRNWESKWLINITDKETDELIAQHLYNPKDKEVLVEYASKSLGDTLAWIPYVDEYRRVNRCKKVHVSSWWNDILQDAYPELEFHMPGDSVPGVYASFKLGAFDDDENRHKIAWKLCPLQKVASDILGLEYREIRPQINCTETSRHVYGDYVCFSEFSTALCKYWNYPDGWKDVISWISNKGLIPVSISKEKTELSGVVKLNNMAIKDTITTLKHAKCFIGVGSGLSWLAWALGVPVVMISGFSHQWCEFQDNNYRLINKSVCHGCFNDIRFSFDRGAWDWCPQNKGFECTKSITPEMVIVAIQTALVSHIKGWDNAYTFNYYR